jgi:hypothetical protein
VWCNTTAVPKGSGGRVPGDAANYNKVAMRVMKDHPEVVVNDLFAFSMPFMVQGNVHVKSEEGRRANPLQELRRTWRRVWTTFNYKNPDRFTDRGHSILA